MSETSKMGLFGSKEDNTSSNTGQLNKDESPERYAPYSVDSDSETYDTEALSIMDINDIIGVQTEPVGDSTLESEIAALTEIITDTNIPEATPEDTANKEMNITTPTVDVDMLVSIKEKKAGPSGQTVHNILSKDSQLTTDESSMKTDSNIDKMRNETNECTSIATTQPFKTKDNKAVNESTYSKSVTAICKSLQLIGEAYDSDDSQDSDTDVMQIGKEPKVIFSCKPFVEKQLCKVPNPKIDNCETVQNKIIYEAAKESTVVTGDTVAIENVVERVEVETKDEAIKESTNETNTEDGVCKSVDDESSKSVRQDPIEVIVNEIPSAECKESVDEQKSAIEPVNDHIEADSTPIIKDTVSLPDNKNHGIEETNDAMIVEYEQEMKPTPEDEVNKMEVDANKDTPAYGDAIHEISQSTSQLEAQEQLEQVSTPHDVNKIVENDALESEEPTADLVAQSEHTVELTLAKKEENIDENLIGMNEKKTNNVNTPEEIPNKPCETAADMNQIALAPTIDETTGAVMSDETTKAVVPDESADAVVTDEIAEAVVSDEIIETVASDGMTEAVVTDEMIETVASDEMTEAVVSDEMIETVASDEMTEAVVSDEMTEVAMSDDTPVINTQEVVSNDRKSVETDTMREDILKSDEKSEVPPQLEEQIIDEAKTSESPLVNKPLDECADSSTKFVDALVPTHFSIDDASEVVQEETPSVDAVEKMDVEVDNKSESLEVISNVQKIIDDKNLPNPNISHGQGVLDENSGVATKVTPDPDSHKLTDNLIVEEEKTPDITQESVTAINETKITQPDIKKAPNELLSTNTHTPPPLVPELDEKIIPALQSSNSESVAIYLEADTIKSVKTADINTNLEKITQQHMEESGDVIENNLLDIPEPMGNISNTVHNISDSKSILEDQENQQNENDVTEPITLSEDTASTTNKVFDDIKQSLLLQSTEILQDALENPTSIHTEDDSLDGILGLDLIPNIDDTEMKSNESMVENVIENIPEVMDIDVKESTLDLRLPEPEVAAINQLDDFFSDVIDTIRESENRAVDADVKMDSESAMETISSLGKEEEEAGDDIELRKEPVQVNSPIDNTDIEESELDTPFTLTREDKLEIPDDILTSPLVAVDSGIEVLQGNSEISELESAVKFLQDSEDHEIESPPVLSPKMIVDIAGEINQREDSATIYPSNQGIGEDSSDLITELESIKGESIAISEAEIINEAAKLESEKKLTEESSDKSAQQSNIEKNKIFDNNKDTLENEIVNKTINAIDIDDATIKVTQSIFPVKSSIIPKTSILEERLKVPPKIEIPIVDSQRLCEMPTTPKASLLIPRDSRISNYQRMMESPKSSMEKSVRDEMKIADASRKDPEKHDIENVGSPRIILKIAKSALTDCTEPRSPKSPKIRSATNSPNPEDSPGQKLGKIKLKLSKGGHPSIIPNDNIEEPALQWYTEGSSSLSPLGMKIKLSKSGDAAIVQHELKETSKHMFAGSPRRTESPFGMKIKLSKSGDASIIQPEKTEDETSREIKIREKTEGPQDIVKRTDSPFGMKIKLLNSGDASIVSSDYDESRDPKIKEKCDAHQDNERRMDSHVGMKIKLSKKGGASIVPTNDSKDKVEIPKSPRRIDSPLGMKIKLSKTGDASIVHSELLDDQISSSSLETTVIRDGESMAGTPKRSESSIGMKIKLSKDGDATIVRSEKQQEEEQQEIKRIDSTIGMKIKLSKTGDASIIQSQINEIYDERSEIKAHKSSDTTTIESMKIRLSKTGHGTIVANDTDTPQRSKEFIEAHHIFSQKREQLVNRSEVTIEPIQLIRRSEVIAEIPSKRKDSVTLSPIETKKSKMDANISQILPEVTIQPVIPRDQNPINFEQSNSSTISRQQMNVISQEISITQLRPNKSNELSVSEKLRKMLTKPPVNSAAECEIIEHHPELIIVNENSNSSQDIMIIDEVPPLRVSDIKTPKKRGRPRRTVLTVGPLQPDMQIPTDPLALDNVPRKLVNNLAEQKDNERPRRTCRSQKSYAPPKRGRGRGRGKRKFDKIDSPVGKRARMEQNLTAMEDCSTALITLDDEVIDEVPNDSSELYKALRQPLKARMDLLSQNPVACTVALKNRVDALLEPRLMARLEGHDSETTSSKTNQVQLISDELKKDPKDAFGTPDHQNWLTPSSKKYIEVNRNDGISTVQVIDEETRMSGDSFSRSQTPARNMSVSAAETTINEESQGSVLSTATTESEKVKVKNRRMEISFDPDEGPFSVDKIAEYEWPSDRKGETFMIQEQISQYLGVKSFKRKYPDLKRRMVDMEERNYLRENGLVSEAMCDMGLTAIYSSEVLDIMCSDFPDQYEEYRKHMREKQIKEHSKKQKELSAAATAEKNRIDLAEMAVQSALSWNVNLNKARRESRRCSLDLQTFTIHVPKKLQKIEEESKVSHYPVALIPGQYTDYYREYTPAELRYYPLNTVLYGPMRPNERKFDSQSEGSQSDSDSDSSSDDSSCSSSEGTQDTEESQSTMDDVDIELSNQKDKSLKCKMCLKHLNKICKAEVLIQCGTCSGHVHPSCIDLTLDMVPHIQAYAWQCTDCKTCVQCHDPADEDKMLFCDMCDRGYHIYCVGLRRVPQGRWHCQECAICASCGSREAGGVNADRNSVALWQHEYKKGDKNTRVYVSTLCVPCSKLWRKGRYCPHCSRCHTVPRLDMEENLVHCSACDKYLHLECVESKVLIIDRKNYQCDLCIQNRQRIVKPSVSKVIRS